MKSATAFAPGSVGNVGPGFDILGLAIEGIGDRVTVDLEKSGPVIVRGIDASLVPTDPSKNAAAIAARAMSKRDVHVTIEKGIPVSAGLGGSASSSVAGAYAAALACGIHATPNKIMLAALEGEIAVSGRHLDNIAPITLGGLVLSRCIDPIDVIALRAPESWSLALITPRVRIETKKARSILPQQWDQASWIQQMANTTALAIAFISADTELVRRALDDRYAEPRRSPMIPHFDDVKRAALAAGAFGCSISGSGPTIFAIADRSSVDKCAEAMRRAAGECDVRVCDIAREGVRGL
ncbi:MAG TPA: homoserine kinase [Thermoanaerobaculia bacterium]